MSNIVRATVSIQGVRPLFWHAFGPDAIPLEKQERTGVAGNDPEEWRKTVLVTKDNQLYIEPTYVFGCVRDAAKYTKKGRGSIQTNVAATLQIVEDRVLIDRYLPEGVENIRDSDEPVYLDVRSVRNPSTKGRNVRYRVAASAGWKTSFTLLFDRTIVSRPEMQAVLTDAGTLVGVGDGRSIGFGRFVVTSFENGE
ncbi:MAG: hypothetical protein V4671_30350 [Armatimonadota bacterium]